MVIVQMDTTLWYLDFMSLNAVLGWQQGLNLQLNWLEVTVGSMLSFLFLFLAPSFPANFDPKKYKCNVNCYLVFLIILLLVSLINVSLLFLILSYSVTS